MHIHANVDVLNFGIVNTEFSSSDLAAGFGPTFHKFGFFFNVIVTIQFIFFITILFFLCHIKDVM